MIKIDTPTKFRMDPFPGWRFRHDGASVLHEPVPDNPYSACPECNHANGTHGRDCSRRCLPIRPKHRIAIVCESSAAFKSYCLNFPPNDDEQYMEISAPYPQVWRGLELLSVRVIENPEWADAQVMGDIMGRVRR